MLFGLMLAYWINYGFYYQHSSAQWRFPLAFQAVFAIYCITVTTFLPDTPRWLLRYKSSPEKGTAVLARLRGRPTNHPVVQREKNDILDAIEIESREEGSWLDLFRGGRIAANKRFYLALGIQFMQQMSGEYAAFRKVVRGVLMVSLQGINIVTYYAPTLFQTSLGMSQHLALLLGALLQVWYLGASFVTVRLYYCRILWVVLTSHSGIR